jgi:hypothetical protein
MAAHEGVVNIPQAPLCDVLHGLRQQRLVLRVHVLHALQSPSDVPGPVDEVPVHVQVPGALLDARVPQQGVDELPGETPRCRNEDLPGRRDGGRNVIWPVLSAALASVKLGGVSLRVRGP